MGRHAHTSPRNDDGVLYKKASLANHNKRRLVWPACSTDVRDNIVRRRLLLLLQLLLLALSLSSSASVARAPPRGLA